MSGVGIVQSETSLLLLSLALQLTGRTSQVYIFENCGNYLFCSAHANIYTDVMKYNITGFFYIDFSGLRPPSSGIQPGWGGLGPEVTYIDFYWASH